MQDTTTMNEVQRRYPDMPPLYNHSNFPEVQALLNRRRETQKLRQMYKEIMDAELKRRNSHSKQDRRMYRSKSAIDATEAKPVKQLDKRRITSAALQTSIGRCTDHRQKTPKYDALTRGCLKVPGFFDKPQKEGRRVSIRVWEDEVKKVVAPRPQYTTQALTDDGGDTSKKGKLKPWLQAPDVHLYVPDAFFHNCRYHDVKRDFVISKEFVSERRDAKKALKILGTGLSIETCL